jgi:murein DD-endopeptidase MepM/ murein hydrolase activator NlpD
MKTRPPIPNGRITYPWGSKNARYARGYHTGDDFACPDGTPVHASHAGTVVEVSTGGNWGGSYGLHIVIKSRTRIQTAYCHLSKEQVHVGQKIAFGQLIGHSGHSGMVTGPHVHFEERKYPYRYGNDRKPRYDK